MQRDASDLSTSALPAVAEGQEITRLSELSSQQWKSGIAAWLGWLFDGLDMHLYTLVATPFVAQLLGDVPTTDDRVKTYSTWIQAAFLVGWAVGGGFFGRIGDRMGRSRALMLTILTYALFTGLSFVAQTWWHLLIFRFLAALGIGGEWAVGASLLSETWPKRWRPWMAAVLQTAVNCGVLLASLAAFLLAGQPPRVVFLIGVLPALLVLWIRREVPETEEWHAAQANASSSEGNISNLFVGPVRRTTILTILVCGFSLTAHWAFTFWFPQHIRNLPELATWTPEQKTELATKVVAIVMVSSIVGNFFAAFLARMMGYRNAIAVLCLAYFFAVVATYIVPRDHTSLMWFLPMMGITQGVFALFTMYLPPLFPTLLRTTGAGFCYNIGRIAAACGLVFFGLFSKVGDYRMALIYASFLFIPAGIISLFMPEPPDEAGQVAPLE